MPISFDHPLVVPIVLGVLGCNAVCLVWLLGMRPGARRARRAGGKPGLANGLRACLAEAVGAFALVFVGVLAVIGGRLGSGTSEPASPVHVALAYGLTVAVMVAALGAVSGGHFNPAVTLGFLTVGRLHPLLGVGYWLAQTAGAVAAAGLLALLFGLDALSAGVPTPGAKTPLYAAVVMETAATFFLVLVVFGTTVDRRGPKLIAPLAVGLTVVLGVLAVGPLSGAALNPVRYFGPALVLQQPGAWMVYLVGPCMGGSVAAVLMQFVFVEEEAEPAAEDPDFLAFLPRRTRRSA